MNSTRLPGKMLLHLLGKPLIQHVIERTQRAMRLDAVVVAIPQEDGCGDLRNAVEATGAQCFIVAGDMNDLVARYHIVASATHADLIVRIPGDNPCVDPAYIDEAVMNYLEWPYLFYTNADAVYLDRKHVIDGLGCEVFSMSRLKWLDARTQGQAEYREHPHKYFYDNEIDVWKNRPTSTIRLDVNTQADYEFVQSIFDHFGHNRFTAAEVVAYLDTKTGVPA